MKSKTLKVGAIVAAGIAVAGMLGIHLWMEGRAKAEREARAAEEVRPKGLLQNAESGRGRSFAAIPPGLPHSTGAAALGAEMFREKRLARTSRRVCAACHLLNEGGTDGVVREGVLTRPVVNAALGTCFLHDGSVTGLASVVRKMFEDQAYSGCGSLEKRVARLQGDAGLVARFKGVYGDGLTSTNVVDTIVQFAHTSAMLSHGTAFDRYCGGRTNVLDEVQREGIVVFQRRGCLACHDGATLGGLRIHGGIKVPGLRGISLRRAYFSDGSCTNLTEAVRRMCGPEVPSVEQRALVAFLGAL